MSVRVCVMFLLPVLLLATSAEALVLTATPTGVPYVSGVEGNPAIDAIDNDLTTHCVINTDSFGGDVNDATISPAGATGTTGHMIFDMGEVMNLTDMTIFSRNHSLQLGPKNFDLFYFDDGVAYNSDDIEGDSNIVLIGNYTASGLNLGNSETFSWASEISTQYIGMRVNSGYPEDTPYNGVTYCNFQMAEVTFDVYSPCEPTLPTAVALVAGESDGNLLSNMIDGDMSTFAVIKDDTLTGSSSATDPENGEAPVTGHIVFDMGEAVSLVGAILTSRNHALSLTPEDVDFFYYADGNPFDNAVADDIEGDADIVSITDHIFSGINLNASEQVDWDAVTTRYIGMRVNSGYESGPDYFNFQIAEMQFIVDTSAVPEPSTFVLLFVGAATFIGVRVRRRHA